MFSTEYEMSTGYEKPFTSFLPLNYLLSKNGSGTFEWLSQF
jgi:hypothetical protein